MCEAGGKINLCASTWLRRDCELPKYDAIYFFQIEVIRLTDSAVVATPSSHHAEPSLSMQQAKPVNYCQSFSTS